MSRENAKLVRRDGDAINRRDVGLLEEIFHTDMEFHSALARSEGVVYRGTEGMLEYFRDVDTAWEDFRIDVADVREAGEQLIVVWRATATSRSGVPLDQLIAQVWTWRDGMPWRNQSFTNLADALEAVRLRE